MATIENGTGDGTAAKVDKEYRLWTHAIVEEENRHISIVDGLYFNLCNSAAHTATNGWQLHLKNIDFDRRLLVQSIHISPSENGFWHLGKNGVLSSGTPITPVNMNFTSPAESLSESYLAPLTYTTQPAFFAGGYVQGLTKYNEIFAGSIVLGVSNSISTYWGWSGATGRVALGIQYYFLDVEKVL